MKLSEKVKTFKYRKRPLSQLKIRQSIEAMEKLIIMYRNDTRYEDCPLCRIANDDCDLCPWTVLTGNNGCIVIPAVIRNGNAPQRIKQLKHWIKAYQDNKIGR